MSKKTLVIGASTNDARYSNKAIKNLKAHNHTVVAHGLRSGNVAGVEIQTEQPLDSDIHTVTMYVGPQNQKGYYDYITALKPKRVLFNPGTENPEFYDKLNKAGIPYEEACTLVLLSINNY